MIAGGQRLGLGPRFILLAGTLVCCAIGLRCDRRIPNGAGLRRERVQLHIRLGRVPPARLLKS